MCVQYTHASTSSRGGANDGAQLTVHVSTQKCIINVYISCCCTALHCRDGIVQNKCLHVQERVTAI